MVMTMETSKNMWRRNGRLNFPLNGCVLYFPLWHPQLQNDTPKPWDIANGGVYSATKTGVTWGIQGGTFDGDDYIKNSTANWRSADSAGTILVWFKTSSASVGLFTSCDEATVGSHMLLFRITAAGELWMYTAASASINSVRGNTAVNDNAWHLGTVISNGTAWSMYADLTLQSLTVVDGSNTGDWFADVANRDNFAIGAAIRSNIILYYTGSIGEVLYTPLIYTLADVTNYRNATRWRYL